MSDGLTTTILGLLIVLSGIGAGAYLWINRPQRHAHEDAPRVQPLFGSEQALALDTDALDEPVRTLVAEPRETARPAAPAPAPREQGARAPVVREFSTAAPGVRPGVHPRAKPRANEGVHGEASAQEAPTRNDAVRDVARDVDTAPASSAPIRLRVPSDGTLQFLPGRLEVVSGTERGREVRFVRPPTFEAPAVTFGRSDGEPYRHVQLTDPTVSRTHARMVMSEQGWRLTNLSTTNPVAYNGRTLDPEEDVLLADGDRVEMGEIVFRFRAP